MRKWELPAHVALGAPSYSSQQSSWPTSQPTDVEAPAPCIASFRLPLIAITPPNIIHLNRERQSIIHYHHHSNPSSTLSLYLSSTRVRSWPAPRNRDGGADRPIVPVPGVQASQHARGLAG